MRPPADPPVRPNYVFDDTTLFDTHRAPIRWIRRLLLPILKLFFNPNPLIQALHIQSQLNTMHAEAEAQQLARGPARDQLTFEVMHNLVLEATRMGIEVKNLKMRVESLSSRLEFNERRARVLESAVVYKATEPTPDPVRHQPETVRREHETRQAEPRPQGEFRPRAETVPDPQAPFAPQAAQGGQPATADGPGQRSRRRRRRRGRRGGASAANVMGAAPLPDAGTPSQTDGQASAGHATERAGAPPSPGEPSASDFGSGGSDPDTQ
jgi:hypothetical protein